MERKGTLTRKVTRSLDESTHEHKHKHTENWDILAITDAFLNQKKVNVCEHAVKWHHVNVYERCHQEVARQETGNGGGSEGKLSGDYLRLMPGLCLEDRMNYEASSRWWRVMMTSQSSAPLSTSNLLTTSSTSTFSSCHPPPTKCSILFSQTIPGRLNCNHPSDL